MTELLLTGRMKPSCDVYSFGIICRWHRAGGVAGARGTRLCKGQRVGTQAVALPSAPLNLLSPSPPSPPPPLPAVWQLLTGEAPFSQMRYAEVVYKVTVAGLRPSFPEHAPPALRQLAEDCWQSKEALRPSFAQVASRLDAMLVQVDAMRAAARPAIGPRTPQMSGAGGGDEGPDLLTLQSPWIAHCNFEL